MKKFISALTLMVLLSSNVSFAYNIAKEADPNERWNKGGYEIKSSDTFNPYKKSVVHKVSTMKETLDILRKDMENYEQIIELNVKGKEVTTEKILKEFYENDEFEPSGVDVIGYDAVQEGKNKIIVTIAYVTTDEENKKILEWSKSWVKKNIKPEMSQEQKVKVIYDYLTDNFKYYKRDKSDTSKDYSYKFSVYGVLNSKKAVCGAYSGAFKLLARESGLEVIDVFGYTYKNKQKTDKEAHAWNLVKIDNDWKHIDISEGIVKKEKGKHKDYKNLFNDEEASKTRTWVKEKYPKSK